ncbi:MAG: STAS domain-containing protein [Planctomycetota bacterium]
MDSPLAEITQDGPRVTVRLETREVETDQLRELVGQLKPAVQAGEVETLAFDLGAVEFLPSACLALLLMLYQEVKKRGGRILLLNCQENVAFLLRLARLDKIFELAEGQPPPEASDPQAG